MVDTKQGVCIGCDFYRVCDVEPDDPWGVCGEPSMYPPENPKGYYDWVNGIKIDADKGGTPPETMLECWHACEDVRRSIGCLSEPCYKWRRGGIP